MKNLLTQQNLEDSTSHTSHVPPQETAPNAQGSFSRIPVVDPPNKKKTRNLKPLWILLGVVFVVGLLVTFLGVLPAYSAYTQAQRLVQKGKELASALKNQNLDEAKAKLPEVRSELKETKTAWDKVYLLKFTPFINLYHQDVVHGLNAGEHSLDAVDIMIASIEPYADLLGFKGGSSFVAGSADERIQLAVKTMDKLTPKVAEIGEKVEKIRNEIGAIDPYRYPEKVRNIAVRNQILTAKTLVSDTTSLFLNARPMLEVLPQLLGEPSSKRYLVIFQNDKELRPTGGFITAYAIFKIEHGKFTVEKSDDIYELDEQIKKKQQAPEEILTFHKGVYYFNIRDSNLSPDFLVSMQKFEELYPGKFDFDGIIAVDTHVLVESIKILGEFNISGRKFSADNDPRCNCPRVIYELEDYATRPVAYVRETRKDILGALLLDIMKRALGVSPSQYWGNLFQMGLTEINEKHILAYMKDEKAQKGIEALNMGGRIADGVEMLGYTDDKGWDYLHINDTNFAGAKSNLFVQHFVKTDYTVEGDGSIIKTVTIDYKNPSPPSDCNLERGALCLNGILRNWVRVYVPKGSTLLEDKGGQSPKNDENPQNFRTYESLDKTVFEGFFVVRPLGTSQVVLKYKLPFKKTDAKLHVLLQKQPGTEGHEYTVLVKGKQKEKFQLRSDKVFSLSL